MLMPVNGTNTYLLVINQVAGTACPQRVAPTCRGTHLFFLCSINHRLPCVLRVCVCVCVVLQPCSPMSVSPPMRRLISARVCHWTSLATLELLRGDTPCDVTYWELGLMIGCVLGPFIVIITMCVLRSVLRLFVLILSFVRMYVCSGVIRNCLERYSRSRQLRKIQSRIIAEDMVARQREFLATQMHDRAAGAKLATGKDDMFQTPTFAGSKLLQ